MSEVEDKSAADDELLHFVQGDKIEVNPDKIEAEISRLWRKAALDQKEGKTRVVTRACLWNLIVRTRGAEGLHYAKQLVDEIAPSVPVRVLLLHEDAGESDRVRAFIETNWMHPGGGVATGSDEITLIAGGRAAARLPSLARALLSSDAPTALLWLGPPPPSGGQKDSDHEAALLGEIDRLIIDTRKTSERDLIGFADLARRKPELEVVDLAWLGLHAWRSLLAQLFDPPFNPADLTTMQSVRVVTEVQGAQASGLALLGWLASRLGWKNFLVERATAEPGQTRRQLVAATGSGHAVHLQLDARSGPVPRGIASVALSGGARQWTLDRQEVGIVVGAPDLAPRFAPKRSRTDAELAIIALGPRGRDPVFREALSVAAGLAHVLQKSGEPGENR